MSEVLDYLASKDIDYRVAPDSNVRTTCFFHDEEGDAHTGRLYIRVDDNDEVPGLFFCLAGETRVVTRHGTERIDRLAGANHELLVGGGNSPGRWVNSPVRSFGTQRLMAVTVRRNGLRKTIRATPEHRWFLKDGTETTTEQMAEMSAWKRVLATNNYQRLAPQYGSDWIDNGSHGIVRGFIFGDGSIQHKGAVAYLYGEKDLAMRQFFDGKPVEAGDRIQFGGFPRFYKTDLPDLDESPGYLYSWLAGYFAADGSMSARSGMELHSSEYAHLQFVRDLCTVLGIRTYGIRTYSRKGIDGVVSDMHRISFVPDDFESSFFLIPGHREQFQAHRRAYARMHWVVESVEDLGIEEEVFCATVEGYGNFTLEDNILTGNCHVCEEKGSLNKIKRHFGDEVDVETIPAGRKVQIFQAAADYYVANLMKTERDDEGNNVFVNQKAIDYLMEERNLSPEAIHDLQLGCADGELLNHLLLLEFSKEDIRATGLVNGQDEDFFQKGTLTIPYFLQNSCIQIRGRVLDAVKNKYRTPPGQRAVLYNTDTMLDTNEVILCEGEFDAMLLHDLGYPAIGVPGVRSFKEDWGRFFSEMKRVYICFDTDEPGQDGAARLASYLGPKARIIEIPKPQTGLDVDVSDYLKLVDYDTSGLDLLLKKARSGALVRVEDAFDAWLDREGNPDLKGLRTGYQKLDNIIKPGLLPGQLAIFLARTGTGKTIQMVNFMHRMIKVQPEAKCLFLSLEQTANEWFERARRVQGFYDPSLIPEFGLNEETIDFYKDNLLMVEKNRVSMDLFRATIRQAKEDFDSELDFIVVDYLGYWARAFKGEPYVRTSDAVMALKEVAKEEGVVIIAPHQVNRGSQPGTKIKLSDSRESGVVEETADFAFGIEKPIEELNAHTAQGVLNLEILKSRHGGVGERIEMIFAPTSLAVVPRIDDVYGDRFYRQAQDEVKWRAAGEYNYESVLERHRTGNNSIMTPRQEEVEYEEF